MSPQAVLILCLREQVPDIPLDKAVLNKVLVEEAMLKGE